MNGERRLAAIDLGTNSFHLVVVRARESGKFEVIGDEKESVRLGSGAGDLEEISPEAMRRGLDALHRFTQIAASHGAAIRAVATSALREARNRDNFLNAAREQCGLEIEVIAGKEEARLIYLGAIQALPLFDRRLFLIDIGGGSTEFVIGKQGTPEILASHKIGAIRLKDRFFPSDPLRESAVQECRRFIRVELGATLDQLALAGFDAAAASSGTAQTLAVMAQMMRTGSQAEIEKRGLVLQRTDLDRVVERILEQPTMQRRARLPGLDEKRADIIVGGALLLQEVVHRLTIDQLQISPFALREGVIFDSLVREGAASQVYPDVRRSSVGHLASQMLSREAKALSEAQHICRLALNLLDGLSASGFTPAPDDDDRLILESAALLHNVGLVISHSAHHKHSYYIIRNSELLLGFSNAEIETIALIARYHRKATPSRRHPEFAALSEAQQQKVQLYAAILRLAIAFDRGMNARVQQLQVNRQDEAAVITALPARLDGASPSDISLEIWAASSRAGALEEALGRKVLIGAAAGATG